ncbi:hypothetical protein [Pseudoduganella armeniaca]|uniref:Uncharacterized protein n=1 Tax=Pseudoduganella armeniaca TaxID=2072590 RepID=A0A2R4CAM7_9BURK|nr:hypothetical protein [Pseudoduganella armeniaca]AVR96686.1 hypothetical protein C9I28_14080 [Pseudoduganella armeniaca]
MQAPADQAITVPAKAQFYGTLNTFNGWYDSTSDSASTFALGDVTFDACTPLVGASRCQIVPKVDASTSGAYAAGIGNVKLAAPGVGSSGSVMMSIGTPGWLPSMKGALTYGAVRSPNIYTYIREMY